MAEVQQLASMQLQVEPQTAKRIRRCDLRARWEQQQKQQQAAFAKRPEQEWMEGLATG